MSRTRRYGEFSFGLLWLLARKHAQLHIKLETNLLFFTSAVAWQNHELAGPLRTWTIDICCLGLSDTCLTIKASYYYTHFARCPYSLSLQIGLFYLSRFFVKVSYSSHSCIMRPCPSVRLYASMFVAGWCGSWLTGVRHADVWRG
jgi:hypothetical protein